MYPSSLTFISQNQGAYDIRADRLQLVNFTPVDVRTAGLARAVNHMGGLDRV